MKHSSMIDINDATQTAYELAYAFHASLHQAKAGTLNLNKTYMNYELPHLIDKIGVVDKHSINKTKKDFLAFLLTPEQDYETGKTSLRMAVSLFEKQAQLFVLEGVRDTIFKNNMGVGLNTVEKILSFAKQRSSELHAWKDEVEQTVEKDGLPPTLPVLEETKEKETKEVPNKQSPTPLRSSDLKNKIKLHKLSREHLKYLQNKIKPFDPKNPG